MEHTPMHRETPPAKAAGTAKVIALLTGAMLLQRLGVMLLMGVIEDRWWEWHRLLTAALVIVNALAYFAIFLRAGQSAWSVCVPFYSAYTLFKVTWGKGKLFWIPVMLPFLGMKLGNCMSLYTIGWGTDGLVFLVPPLLLFTREYFVEGYVLYTSGLWFINIPVTVALVALRVVTMHKLAAGFEKDFRYTLGLIFLGPLYALRLGLGKNDYIGPM